MQAGPYAQHLARLRAQPPLVGRRGAQCSGTGQTAAHAQEASAPADQSVKANAVESKLFGRLTRETWEWHPAPLLCKRFGAKDPETKRPYRKRVNDTFLTCDVYLSIEWYENSTVQGQNAR